MAISSISYNLGNSYGAYVQRLSEATKRKLIALGIPFTEKTTESEAQGLISKALAEQAENNSNKKDSSLQSKHSKQDDTFEQAKRLADKLGITVNDKMKIDTILSLIEAKLEEEIKANKENISLLNELQKYSSELSILQAKCSGSSGFDSPNQALMMSLEMLSVYNKNFLNN